MSGVTCGTCHKPVEAYKVTFTSPTTSTLHLIPCGCVNAPMRFDFTAHSGRQLQGDQ